MGFKQNLRQGLRKKMKRHIVIVGALFVTLTITAAVSREDWQRYTAEAKEIPGLVRFYTFTSAQATQPDLAGSGGEMTLSGTKEASAQVEEGRIAGMTAVSLDETSFRAAELKEVERDFAVSIWIKPKEAGSQQPDGRVCGMITSSGSGYYDGWRLTVQDMVNWTPSFEIGRGKNSIGLRSKISLNPGFWNHLAASWDGRSMKLFVNGMFAGQQEFSGPHQPAKGSLAVGYSGYGVGSLRMAVDELAVFNRALSAGEITALSLMTATLPDKEAVVVNAVHSLQVDGAADKAELELKKAASGDYSPRLKVWAEAASVFQNALHKTTPENTEGMCRLYENPALPAHLKGALLFRLFKACGSSSQGIPSRILERLPVEMELTDDQKFTCALALANRYVAENKAEMAFKVFDHLISASKGDCQKMHDLLFNYARHLRVAGRSEEAVKHYLAAANSRQQPGYVRAIAALALARTYREQGKYDQAIEACRTICSSEIILPHHKYEADEIVRECENLKAEKPARDPEDYRRRPEALPRPGALFFVSPKGFDTNPGTRNKPFATLVRARDAVREMKKSAKGLPAGGVTVYLRGGTYRMDAPLELTAEDSGTHGAPVVYAAWQDEEPVFDGGFEVKNFKKARDYFLLERLPQEARGKVYVADLKSQGYSDFEKQQGYGYGVQNETIRSVYEDGEFLEMSRWPNSGRIPVDELIEGNDRAFKVDCDRLSRWATAEDMMVDGFWYHLWAGEALHVEKVNPGSGVVTLAKKPGRGLREGRPFYVMNLLEEIDRPGEWFIDRGNGLLYIWLKKHRWFTDVVVAERKQPFIRAEGVRDIVFRGIAFQYGQGRAALFNNCANLSIIGCRFHGFGGTALQVLNAANAGIYGNKLDTLGHGGMHVTGGNRKNLTSGGIHIENNEVGHFGLCSKTYVPAILLEGVGARVAHNWFHHAPSSAMRIEGNDHLVEYNLTEYVVRESDDQGGIDMWSNASYRGCVMRYNIWRDIGGGEAPCGQAGIRFDDAISGMVVYGNIFERSSNGHFGGVQIHGGHMNIIDNNVFIDCHHAVSFSPWSLQRFREYITENTAGKIYIDVNIDLPPYSTRYPSLKALKDESKHNVNSIWRNIITGTDTPWRNAPNGTDFCDNFFADLYSTESAIYRHSTFNPIPVDEIACAW